MELLCPAGNMPALKAAIDHGADAVYIGLKDATNARHFPGLNFSIGKMQEAAQYVHKNNKHLHVAINTFAKPECYDIWKNAIDTAVGQGADVLILADIASLDYAHTRYPEVDLHLSVQASATNSEAIAFYKREFNIQRVVLPRVLPIHQVRRLKKMTEVPLEVFAFGSLCIMAEGRCYLSSYVTGQSPNTAGACSPAEFVSWKEGKNGRETRLNDVLVDRYQPNENAGYPTLCKGRFQVNDQSLAYHALEEPTSLNTLSLIPDFFQIGIASVKIEGRQRSPAYVATVTKIWRAAIDAYLAHQQTLQSDNLFEIQTDWSETLSALSEGKQTTLGAYQRKWQ